MADIENLDHSPLADIHHRQLHKISLAVESEYVLTNVGHRYHSLLLVDRADRGQLVPIKRGKFESHLLTRSRHALRKSTAQLIVTPRKELIHGVDLHLVRLAGYGQHTGRRATLDLMLDAWALPATQFAIRAGAELEMLLD
jgi:hypothetical protein